MHSHDVNRSHGDQPVPAIGRYGEHTATGGVSFRCGACGEVAAVVKLLPAGDEADMGPPFGRQRQNADGVIIDYWLRSTCWMATKPDRWARIEAVLSAPYWCRDCQLCYCRDDWQRTVIFDGPFYDYTDGVCPAGHRHMIDD
jgi:hypothetical protein